MWFTIHSISKGLSKNYIALSKEWGGADAEMGTYVLEYFKYSQWDIHSRSDQRDGWEQKNGGVLFSRFFCSTYVGESIHVGRFLEKRTKN